ncbi:MAG: hypothetical protein E6H54_04540 [Betaproteobacteria bacterium]|nr:MAG: hypothetical protein E6H54_04540 [Betaproteobacteria bacterium]
MRYCGPNELGRRELREPNEEDAARERLKKLRPDLQAEARLATSSGPRESDQPLGAEKHRRQLGELPHAADERIRSNRQVRRVQAPERRKVAVAELVNALRRCQILQPVIAEIAQTIRAHEVARRS